MIPPRSPYGLIQEDLWPNSWLILVACMMLNCTTRKQVDKVFPLFKKKWPTPQNLLTCDKDELIGVIKPLGFGNRRADALIRMTTSFLKDDWSHVKQLPGIGEYASRAWEIFCCGIIGDEAPSDHALVKYYYWRKQHESQQETRRSETHEGQNENRRAA